ncbi:MAG: hypothetical protein H6732_19690 [Alphaproteobacteria bacterium]|nr:hypothetical protein [Alphaproteobacteria bacterium]
MLALLLALTVVAPAQDGEGPIVPRWPPDPPPGEPAPEPTPPAEPTEPAPEPVARPEPTPVLIGGMKEREEPAPAAPAEDPDRLRYELGVRARYINLPAAILDGWYTDSNTTGWPLEQSRPVVQGMSFGLEFNVQKKQTFGLFYIEYAHSLVEAGYWDRRNQGVQSDLDGTWVRPSKVYGAVIIGANGVYDAPVVTLAQTKGRFAMSFVIGGGLGIAVLVGELDQWVADQGTTPFTPAYARKDLVPPDKKVDLRSPVWPAPDLMIGFKFLFVDHAWFRLEGGLHGALYGGITVGGRF